ncbi:MAG: Transcriptional regulator, AraC family [Gammaproteobacteria bacterium]|jgi:AraC family transcriptional regulator|nr:Transcriptional regulator, AraC family [Gammaproteobacteria bacterium]
MVHALSDTNRQERRPHSEVTSDVKFAWADGSVHFRAMAAEGRCERKIVRKDLAIGICFQNPGSAVQWHLDGKPVLNKIWPSSGGSRDLIILPAGHEFVGRCRGSGQGLWLFIDPQSINLNSRIKAFAERARTDCSWAHDRLSWTIATELRKECRTGFPRGLMFIESASMALLAQLAYVFDKAAAPESQPFRALSQPKLSLVLEYIDSNLDHNVTLAELASLVELTPRYFCEVFRRAMGRPPHQFQIEQRIERAKSLLHRPLLRLSDIALMVGFSSQSHLNVYFRRIVGVTPARYRSEALSAQSGRYDVPSYAAAAEISKTL